MQEAGSPGPTIARMRQNKFASVWLVSHVLFNFHDSGSSLHRHLGKRDPTTERHGKREGGSGDSAKLSGDSPLWSKLGHYAEDAQSMHWRKTVDMPNIYF